MLRKGLLGPVCLVVIALLCVEVFAKDLKAELIRKVPFYNTATGRFAPLYPAFTQQMVQDYGITEGICVDVGSSIGSFSMELAKITKMTVYALDIDVNGVRLCGILVDEAGLTGRVIPIEGDAQNMPFKNEFADLVFSRGSIPFWQDREAGVRECYRILKPGGVAYIGGGFSRILDPKIRDPIAQWRADLFEKRPDPKFKRPIDLDKVAAGAGIPADQYRFINEPIAGWWLEIRKPADHTAWYRAGMDALKPWYEQMAQQITERYGIKRGRCLEMSGSPGPLSLLLAPITDLDFWVACRDTDEMKVVLEQARALGYGDRIQAVSCPEDHLLFRDRTFDLVVGHAGAAFWERPERAYKEIARVLRPGGIAIVGTGAPFICSKKEEAEFVKAAKASRKRSGGPPNGWKRCPERHTVEKWIQEAGLKGRARIISPKDIHSNWVEIRGQKRRRPATSDQGVREHVIAP